MGSESKSGNGLGELPASTRKMIQNLKEVVNCSESEIYAVLKECNMDPDEAVQRLLSQDTFHEVKSKRERRKEMKETQESRPQVTYGGSSRGVRSAGERNIGWGGSNQTSYDDFGNVAFKGEKVLVNPSLSYSAASITRETMNQQPSFLSDSLNIDGRRQLIGTGDLFSSVGHSSLRCQPALLGTSNGHLSMADIVRLGKPPSKASLIPAEISSTHQDADASNPYYCYDKPSAASAPIHTELHPGQHFQNASILSETINKSDKSVDQNGVLEEWPRVEQPTTFSGSSSSSDASVTPDANMHSNQSNNYGNGSKMSGNCRSGIDAHISQEYGSTESVSPDHIDVTNDVRAFHSDGNLFKDSNSYEFHTDGNLFKDSNSYDFHMAAYKNGKGTGSKSSDPNYSSSLNDNDIDDAARKLQFLTIQKEMEEKKNLVVLPTHVQALTADCSHLSFGTYKSGRSSTSTGLFSSHQSNDDLQEASTALDRLSTVHSETRNIGHNSDKSLGTLFDTHREIADARGYDLPVPLQPELKKQDAPEITLGSDYMRPDLHDSNVENNERTAPGFSFADSSLSNTYFQNGMAHLDSKPSDLLVSNIQSLRGSDSLHSQFLATQTVPSRHSNAVSSIGSPTELSIFSEVRKPGTIPLSGPSSVFPQHRMAHSYSQQSPPLAQPPSNQMIDYSSNPQNYSHLPSNFQQAFLDEGFRQSPPGLDFTLPQYDTSLGRYPGASAAAGYGGHGTSNHVPANYLQRPASLSGYRDVFYTQHKDGNFETPLPQNNSSPTWNYGPGSRTRSPYPDSMYHNLLGHNQQHPGYQQPQRLPEHYGALGYSDLYRSQVKSAQEYQLQQQQQQQSLGGLSGVDNPDLLSQQLHQFWQQNY